MVRLAIPTIIFISMAKNEGIVIVDYRHAHRAGKPRENVNTHYINSNLVQNKVGLEQLSMYNLTLSM